jgi:hypothetical protein
MAVRGKGGKVHRGTFRLYTSKRFVIERTAAGQCNTKRRLKTDLQMHGGELERLVIFLLMQWLERLHQYPCDKHLLSHRAQVRRDVETLGQPIQALKIL